jgi:hypothetical protein
MEIRSAIGLRAARRLSSDSVAPDAALCTVILITAPEGTLTLHCSRHLTAFLSDANSPQVVCRNSLIIIAARAA